MTGQPRDNWDSYFADKLWRLMPAVYRTQDTDQYDANGPLRELVNRIGASAAAIRRSTDRLWDDQSIETCDDWVIPYIGDLVGTRLILGLDAAAQRRDVANTIAYRRRKGTLAVIEQIASDVTGWDVKAVEFFRRIARSRHGLDPPLGLAGVQPGATLAIAEGLIGANTGTPIGGLADLRDVAGSRQNGTAFDEFFHTADLRAGQGTRGSYAIPRLGLFVWRLSAFVVTGVTPVAVKGCPGWYCFDPTGRDMALFARSRAASAAIDAWVSPGPTGIAAPITQATLDATLFSPVVSGNGQHGHVLMTGGWSDRIADLPNIGDVLTIDGVMAADPQNGLPTGALQQFTVAATVTPGRDGAAAITIAPGLVNGIGGTVAQLPADGAHLQFVTAARASLYGDTAGVAGAAMAVMNPALVPATDVTIRPERGRFLLKSAANGLTANYAYGFSSQIGAGPYDRRMQAVPVSTPAPIAPVAGGGIAVGGQATRGTIRIADSRTYGAATVDVAGHLTIAADNLMRPLIRLAPGQNWVIRGTAPDASLALDGLWISGGDVILTGSFAAVTITCSTLDPGEAADGVTSPPGDGHALSADGRALVPTRLIIEAAIATLVIDRSIIGPVRARDYDPARDPAAAAPTATAPGKGLVEVAHVANTVVQALSAHRAAPLTLTDFVDGARLGARLADARDPATQSLIALEARLASPPRSPPIASPPLMSPPFVPTLINRFNAIALQFGLGRGLIEGLFPLEVGESAFAFADGTLDLSRCTVIGRVNAHRLTASECLLTDVTVVDDQQDGCVRFSAVTGDGRLPRAYECVTVPTRAPLYVSTRFGDPGYAQLRADADSQCLPPDAALAAQQSSILTGAADGSEMGAFARDKNPIRATALLAKIRESMPASLAPVVITMT